MKYPIGIQSFEDLRKRGCVYVDKTSLVYKIAQEGKYYFLSRPRRFGKSLLVSTLEAYFLGKRELFDGLAVADMEKEWTEYPVLHFDLTGKSYSKQDDLDKHLANQLEKIEACYNVKNKSDSPDVRLSSIIDSAVAKTGKPVVILIDEYDKPIVDNLDNEELMEVYRKQLQGFYSVMKAKDAYIRFGFLTGVTKIGKLSVFSGLNNLQDISLDTQYSDICGISEIELRKYFAKSVKELAEANNLTEDECYAKLAEMYDGYHFSDGSDGMYNPFSLLNALASKRFREYWFETGTPTFLVKLIKDTSYDITLLQNDEADSDLLTSVNSIFSNPIPMLYQSGYLTITGYDEEYGLYRLGFPNKEVRNGFMNFLLNFYLPNRNGTAATLISQMARDVRTGQAESFMRRMEALFARSSYQIQGDSEKDFQYAIYLVAELMGDYAEVERTTSNGRIDLLIQTKDYIYIIEIKINDSAEAALKQINEKGYARPFADDKRKLFKLGIKFSVEDRCITEWKIEE